MIDLAILGLLTEQELHGYELKKRLGELLVQPRLDQLRVALPGAGPPRGAGRGQGRRGSARAVPSATPMTGSLAGELAAFKARVRERGLVKGGGRGKKVYGITDVGRERLVELLSDPDVSDDRAFTLRVAFARHLAPGRPPRAVRAPPHRAARPPGRPAPPRRPAAAPTPTSARCSSATPTTSPTTSPGSIA